MTDFEILSCRGITEVILAALFERIFDSQIKTKHAVLYYLKYENEYLMIQ